MASRSTDANDYEVGYKKPPKVSRFKKGRSGNPQGRPKGSKNLVTLFNEELDKTVIIQENGKKIHVTKREALVKRVVHAALNGDSKSTSALISMDQSRQAEEPEIAELSETDIEQYRLLQQRILDKARREKARADSNKPFGRKSQKQKPTSRE